MVLGLGCFAPSLMLLALFFSWWWVRRFGFTPWDRKLGTTDVLLPPRALRSSALWRWSFCAFNSSTFC